MSVLLELPSALARYAGGKKSLIVSGDTVHALVEALCQDHPQLRSRVLDKNNQLYPYLILIKNDLRLSPQDLCNIPLKDGDTLEVMTLAGGG